MTTQQALEMIAANRIPHAPGGTQPTTRARSAASRALRASLAPARGPLAPEVRAVMGALRISWRAGRRELELDVQDDGTLEYLQCHAQGQYTAHFDPAGKYRWSEETLHMLLDWLVAPQ